MTDIYLIRHAKSEANINRLYGTDAPLSDIGVKQAEDAAKKLNIMPDIVISGTKIRQRTTASILFPDIYQNVAVHVFDEIYFGDLENANITDEINHGVIKDVLSIKTAYNGDDVWERAERAVKYIKNIGYLQPGKIIAIITSDTLMQTILTYLNHGKTNGIIWSGEYDIQNCSYWYLSVDNNKNITTIANQETVEQAMPELSLFKTDI